MVERNLLESNLPRFLPGSTGVTMNSPLRSSEYAKRQFYADRMKEE
jgi:hypothetical protein